MRLRLALINRVNLDVSNHNMEETAVFSVSEWKPNIVQAFAHLEDLSRDNLNIGFEKNSHLFSMCC